MLSTSTTLRNKRDESKQSCLAKYKILKSFVHLMLAMAIKLGLGSLVAQNMRMVLKLFVVIVDHAWPWNWSLLKWFAVAINYGHGTGSRQPSHTKHGILKLLVCLLKKAMELAVDEVVVQSCY